MEALITVGEYIRQLQPDIFQFLCQKFNICAKDITQQIIAAVNIVEGSGRLTGRNRGRLGKIASQGREIWVL